MKYIVIWGNPADGFQFWGPFASLEAAEKWAKKTFAYNHEWSYAELKPLSKHPIY